MCINIQCGGIGDEDVQWILQQSYLSTNTNRSPLYVLTFQGVIVYVLGLEGGGSPIGLEYVRTILGHMPINGS